MIRYAAILMFSMLAIKGRAQSDTIHFVALDTLLSKARFEYPYYSGNNFMGERVDGYKKPEIWLSIEAAKNLKRVEARLAVKGYGLIIFDGYRPQRAVDDFMNWTRSAQDTAMKSEYYPDVRKSHLVSEGYIAQKSGHSRGSTVDLSLYHLDTGEPVDMGTPFDYFGPESHPGSRKLTRKQRRNRMILRKAMLAEGFEPLSTEWWHFSLKAEPYPNTYFDIPVE
jgi:D-alanyl-D-alanine dipeptidase